MQSKVEMYKGTMEDQNSDRLAMLKEKDLLMKEHIQLKNFIPELEVMDKSHNKVKFLVEMRERCSPEEFSNYLYQYVMVQVGRQDEQLRKNESLQKIIDQRETTIKGLELTNDDLKKQLEAKKKIIAKMKENVQTSAASTAHSSLQIKSKPIEEDK